MWQEADIWLKRHGVRLLIKLGVGFLYWGPKPQVYGFRYNCLSHGLVGKMATNPWMGEVDGRGSAGLLTTDRVSAGGVLLVRG